MSRDEDIGKALGNWLGKAKKLGTPPQPSEVRDTLNRAEPARAPGEGGLTQLNFKVPLSTKKRIKQLALRDNITLLAMLDLMLELYEREHGKLGK